VCLSTPSGCDNADSRKERFIREMVQDGLSVKEKVLQDSNGIMEDMKVYRDGEKDGVVFEHIYAAGVQVDQSLLSEQAVKEKMLMEFKKQKDAGLALNSGIYVRIIYRASNGRVYADVAISNEDL
ncbi:MAG: hypothetical protein P8M80_01475, partial [Pirellulaceae bacterium]|nr:hypothetical protein [Pirellulaceae bacterium]